MGESVGKVTAGPVHFGQPLNEFSSGYPLGAEPVSNLSEIVFGWDHYGCAGQHDHNFPARRRLLVVRSNLEERSATELLVMLGQFTRHRNLSGTTGRLGEVVQRLDETVCALKQDHGVGQRGGKAQLVSALASFSGQKTENGTGVRYDSGAHERRQRGGGAGNRDDPNPRRDCCRDQSGARIGDQRRPRIGDQRQRFARTQPLDEPRGGLRFVVLVQGEGRGPDAVALQQRARMPGVLTADARDPLQDGQGADGEVAQMTNGRADDVQRPGGGRVREERRRPVRQFDREVD